jgi:hypothetical protein
MTIEAASVDGLFPCGLSLRFVDGLGPFDKKQRPPLDRDTDHRHRSPVAIFRILRSAGIILPRDKPENAMTDTDKNVRELTVEELEAVSGGRMKIPMPDAVKAYLIAKIERDNPGF